MPDEQQHASDPGMLGEAKQPPDTSDRKKKALQVQFVETVAEPEQNEDQPESNASFAAGFQNTKTDVSASSPKAKVTKSGSLHTLQKSITTTTNFRIGGRGLFRSRTKVPAYTIDQLECTIYDNSHHNNDTMVLMPEALGLVEGGVHAVPDHLFRCLTDVTAQYADALMIIAVIGTCASTPLTFIWGGDTWSSHPGVPGAPYTFVADILMDVIYAGHLLLQLNTSFIHPDTHVEVVRRKSILWHHFGHPMYWVRWLGATVYFWIAAGAPTLVNNVKLVRLLHLRRLPDSLWQVSDSSAYRMALPIVTLILCSHWVACVFAYFGGYREARDEDAAKWYGTTFEGHAVKEHISAYLMVFIESLYMLTGCLDNPLGEGGPREKNFGSLVIVSIFGPLGCVGVAMFIAAIVREQALHSVLDMRHAENKAFISTALNNLNIPKELQRRVFSLHYFQRMSHDFEAFEELFGRRNLSGPLESALRVYLYNESVLYARYFKGKDPNYILEVVRILEDSVFLPGDYVARCGEVGTQMYFVARGRLSVLIPHRLEAYRNHIEHAEEITTLKKGDYFGDVALLEDCRRTAWVRADSYCLLSMLARQKIEDIWKYFPQERLGLVNSFKMRLAENRSVHAQHNWKKGAASAFTANKVMKAMRTTSKMQQEPLPADVDEASLPSHAAAGNDAPQHSGNGAADKPPDKNPTCPCGFICMGDSEFCRKCGLKIQRDVAGQAVQICACGSVLGSDEEFCRKCGQKKGAHAVPTPAPGKPAPGEEEGADCPNIGNRRTRLGKAPTHDEMKFVAMRVESACQVLVTGHRKMKKRMEALSSRVVSLAEGQVALADILCVTDSVSASAEPSALAGPFQEGPARAARFAAVETHLAPDAPDVALSGQTLTSARASNRRDMYMDRILAPLQEHPGFPTSAVIDEDPLDEKSVFTVPTKAKNGTARSFGKKRANGTPVSRTDLWED